MTKDQTRLIGLPDSSQLTRYKIGCLGSSPVYMYTYIICNSKTKNRLKKCVVQNDSTSSQMHFKGIIDCRV